MNTAVAVSTTAADVLIKPESLSVVLTKKPVDEPCNQSYYQHADSIRASLVCELLPVKRTMKKYKTVLSMNKNEYRGTKKLTLYGNCGKIISAFLYGGTIMEHILTIETRNLCESAKNGGCGECQTSCQSACKTSCGIANQQCENK